MEIGERVKEIMEKAWSKYGGNNQPEDFWETFSEAVMFTLAEIDDEKRNAELEARLAEVVKVLEMISADKSPFGDDQCEATAFLAKLNGENDDK